MKTKSFGEILEDLMDQKNLSIAKLAKELSVSPKTVQEWVGKGGRIPRNPESLKKLASYFDISVHYLLFGEDDPKNLIENFLEKTEIHSGLYEITIKKVSRNNK